MLFSPLAVPPLYLDPGSGSILIQMIIAAILGAGVLVRSQWSRIKKWLGRGNDSANENDETDGENSGQS
jgi:hypothetical protein